MSEIQVNKISPRSGTDLTLGDSGDTFTVPSGATLTTTNATVNLPATTTVTTELKTNKISPASGTAFTLGDSGDTFTIPAGATITNSGTATGFGGGGKVLQVIHGTDETLRETTSTSYASLTLNASITPAATSSKVLVLLNIATSSAFDEKYSYFTIFRDSTDVGNSDGSGFFYTFDSDGSGDVYMAGSLTHLDSPSTTSSVTYTLYGKCTSGGKARINVGSEGRSTITLMEIGA